MRPSTLGLLAGIAAYVLWGLLTVYWHALEGIDPFALVGHRILWSTLLLVVVVALTGGGAALWALRRDRARAWRLGAAAALLAVNWISYVWCVTHDMVVETALGYFVSPVITVLVGVVVLRERLRPAQVAALGLACAAIVVLTVGYGAVPVFALAIAFSWATYALLKKQVGLGAVPGLTAEMLVLTPFAALGVVGLEATGGGVAAQADAYQIVLLAGVGVVTAVPLLLFAAAATRVPLTTLGWLQYLVPTIVFVLGVAVYHEPMPAWRVAGFALVWAGLAVLSVDGLRAAHRAAHTSSPAPAGVTPALAETG